MLFLLRMTKPRARLWRNCRRFGKACWNRTSGPC